MTLEELIQELNSIRQLRGGEIKIEVIAYTRECDYHELKISSIKADTNRDCPIVKIIAE